MDNNKPLHIRNVYILPASSCSPGYIASISKLSDGLATNSLIISNFNAHHDLWYTVDAKDARGEMVADWISDSTLRIINEDVPTRVTAQASTAPDISIASSCLIPTCTWSVEYSLSSDHLPILITLASTINKIKSDKRTYINFSKVEDNVHKSEKIFRQILNKASKKYIPKGRIQKIKQCTN